MKSLFKQESIALFGLLLLVFLSGCEQQKTAHNEKIEAVRGVWLTNVASDALYSRENIREAVENCKELGFNTIFMVSWNKGYTIYQSDVMQEHFGTSIIPDLAGRDPLQELIEEAHARDIKVFAWFEFGFAASINDPTGGHILQKYPHWAARDIEGNIAEKNNFQWMNPFHPEVQEFIQSLIIEVVEKYEVDGIQGDDRLPALPSNGGYSEFTKALYASEHSGKNSPEYAKDYQWVKWRSSKLNLFLKKLVEDLRQRDPELIISMAPSIYEWSEENYLQDWPTWLDMGLVDLIIPQVYRYNLKAYENELDKILSQQLGNVPEYAFVPGVLLQVSEYNPTDSLLQSFIDANRARSIHGEVFFFYEGIKKYPDLFKSAYSEPVSFPSFK